MFKHQHPFSPFIPKEATKLIVGTMPPPRFSLGELKKDDVNFCYGSIDGLLWPVLNTIFNLNLDFETTEKAIKQRKDFLISKHIGICDIVEYGFRTQIDASDLGLSNLKLRPLIAILEQHPKIDTLIFTGGNSKNGPEYLFRKLLKTYQLKLNQISNNVPRIHSVKLPISKRKIITHSLTAPSGAANRAIGSMALYKQLKQSNPNFNTFNFRVMQYREVFGA